MARQIKTGIDYFSHDVDMLQDKKIKIIKAKHGLVGYAVYLRLLEELYRENGYYLTIDDDFNILFADDNNLDFDVYISILNDCIIKELFDSQLYEKYSILTSKRIQENYISATERRKEVELEKSYCILDVNILGLNVYINSLNVDIGTQSKVKESKEDNTKEKKTKAQLFQEGLETVLLESNIFDPVSSSVKEFIEHRKIIKKPMSLLAVKKFIKKLQTMTDGPNKQIALMDEAIANGWQTVYPLKNNINRNPLEKHSGLKEFLEDD